jgi:hypothetical protein
MLMCLFPAHSLCHAAAAPATAARSLNSAISGLIHEKVDHVKDTIDHLKSKHHQQAIVAPNYLITQQPQYVVAAMPQYMPQVMAAPVVAGAPTVQAPPPPPPTVEEKEITVRGQQQWQRQQQQQQQPQPRRHQLTASRRLLNTACGVPSIHNKSMLCSCAVGAGYAPCPARGRPFLLNSAMQPSINLLRLWHQTHPLLLLQIYTPRFKPVMVPLPLLVPPHLAMKGAGKMAGNFIKAVAKAVIENADTEFVVEEEEGEAPAAEPMQPAPVPSAPADTVFVPTPVPTPVPVSEKSEAAEGGALCCCHGVLHMLRCEPCQCIQVHAERQAVIH